MKVTVCVNLRIKFSIMHLGSILLLYTTLTQPRLNKAYLVLLSSVVIGTYWVIAGFLQYFFFKLSLWNTHENYTKINRFDKLNSKPAILLKCFFFTDLYKCIPVVRHFLQSYFRKIFRSNPYKSTIFAT